MGDGSSGVDIERLAAGVGASDVFVLRRVTSDRLVQVGGIGRGSGWAGVFDVDLDDEPLLSAALTDGEPRHRVEASASRLLGPYYGLEVVVVPLPPDSAVVLATSSGPLADDVDWPTLARVIADEVHGVSLAKRLADELEVMHALQELYAGEPAKLRDAMSHVATVAARALSCELAIVYWAKPDESVTVADGWPPPASEAERHWRVRRIHGERLAEPLCIQDLAHEPLGAPFDATAGCLSAYTLPLGDDEGVLVLIHTEGGPRGFTQLCRELGRKLAEASGPLLRASAARDQLTHEADVAYGAARQDALTGLGNRRAWDEALTGARRRQRRDEALAVAFADIHALKEVNDQLGLAAGDELIRAAAATLGAAVRSGDTVARIGGDEFGILLPGADESEVRAAVERIQGLLEVASAELSAPLEFALGWAARPADGEIDEAIAAADRMLRDAKAAQAHAQTG